MSSPNGTISYYYDDWGRMTQKNKGYGWVATYGYHYGQMLTSVATNFPGEGNVTYDYGGDGKGRSRTQSGVTLTFNWSGHNIVSEEDPSGNLINTYMAGAHVSGSNPNTGTYYYYVQDRLESIRLVTDGSKDVKMRLDYSPYGSVVNQEGTISRPQYTTHQFDHVSELYFSQFRFYSADMGRWLTRDPLGMIDGPNLYVYVQDNPINANDPLGLCRSVERWAANLPWAGLGESFGTFGANAAVSACGVAVGATGTTMAGQSTSAGVQNLGKAMGVVGWTVSAIGAAGAASTIQTVTDGASPMFRDRGVDIDILSDPSAVNSNASCYRRR